MPVSAPSSPCAANRELKLLVAIPALNEESSIASIIERSLNAREEIIATSPVSEMEICVVSDGSTDQTVEIASRYVEHIRLVVFPENRGYGAAIKEAWKGTDADLLGFLDADGTCDPRFFSDLCRGLIEQDADIALGCRLNKDTKMPMVRRIGNLFFACLLTVITHARVRDTASGMRVLRKAAYLDLLPLPDGLHFTPSMSARAMLGAGGGLKLIELDMAYSERQGQSKLKVIRDGFRFLDTIFRALFRYHPERPFRYAALALAIVAAGLLIASFTNGSAGTALTPESSVLLVVSYVAITTAVLLFLLSLFCRRVIQVVFSQAAERRAKQQFSTGFFAGPWYWLLTSASAVTAIWVAASASRTHSVSSASPDQFAVLLLASFLLLVTFVLTVARVVFYFLTVVSDQFSFEFEREAARDSNRSRIRP